MFFGSNRTCLQQLVDSYGNLGLVPRLFYPKRLGKAILRFESKSDAWTDKQQEAQAILEAVAKLPAWRCALFASVKQFKDSALFTSYMKLQQLQLMTAEHCKMLLANQDNLLFHELLSTAIELEYLTDSYTRSFVYEALVRSKQQQRLLTAFKRIAAAEVRRPGFSDVYPVTDQGFLNRLFLHDFPDCLVETILQLQQLALFHGDFQGHINKRNFINNANILVGSPDYNRKIWTNPHGSWLSYFNDLYTLTGRNTSVPETGDLEVYRSSFLLQYYQKFPGTLGDNSELKADFSLSTSIWLLEKKWNSEAEVDTALLALEARITNFEAKHIRQGSSKYGLFLQQRELALRNLQYLRRQNPCLFQLSVARKARILEYLQLLEPQLHADIQARLPQLRKGISTSEKFYFTNYLAALVKESHLETSFWIEALSFAGNLEGQLLNAPALIETQQTNIPQLNPYIKNFSQYFASKSSLFFQPKFDCAVITRHLKHLLLDSLFAEARTRQTACHNQALDSKGEQPFCEFIEHLQDAAQAAPIYQRLADRLNYPEIVGFFLGLTGPAALEKNIQRFKASLIAAPALTAAQPFWDATRVNQQFKPLIAEAAKMRRNQEAEKIRQHRKLIASQRPSTALMSVRGADFLRRNQREIEQEFTTNQQFQTKGGSFL